MSYYALGHTKMTTDMSLATESPKETMSTGCCPPIPQSMMTASRNELTDLKLEVVEGQLPQDLQGHVFIIAPVGSVNSGGLPDPDGNSMLNGDGMIYRLDFDKPGEVRLTSRLMKTPCYYADKATRRGSKYHKYRFRNHGILRFSIFLGARNELNTAFLPMNFNDGSGDRLLVTYDAGRSYEIDTETLELATSIGTNKEWRSEASLKFPFEPVFSTAHPAFDGNTKEMFTVNYGRSIGSFLESIPFLYEIDRLPVEVNDFLAALAELLDSEIIQNVYTLFAQFSRDVFREVFQFYLSLISQFTQIEIKDFVYLVRWDGVGNLERWRLVLPDRTPVVIEQTIHQIGVTKDYVVLMDTSFTTGLEQVINNPFPDDIGAEKLLRKLLALPPLPDSQIYIVSRADLKDGQIPACSQREVEVIARKVVIPMEAAHFLVDCENPDDQITLHVSHICAWDVSEWLRRYDVSAYQPNDVVPHYLNGMEQNEMDISRFGRYRVNGETAQIISSKVIYDLESTWGPALYAYHDWLPTTNPPQKLDNIYWISFGLWKDAMTKFIVSLYKDYKYRAVPLEELLRLAEKGIPSNLLRVETSQDVFKIADCYQFPQGYFASSPQFMPRNDGQDSSTNGYIICTISSPENQNEIWIFDASNLAAGPLSKLTHPNLNFGLTIHTAWLPKIARRTASYNIPVRQDYEEIVKQKSPEIQELFEQEIYPHFQ